MSSYNVEGVMFPRPFRIRRFGHFGINLSQIDDGVDFYGRLLGFDMTDMPEIRKLAPPGAIPDFVLDDRVPFLTHNSDHHSMIISHPSAGPFIGDEGAGPEYTLSHFTWQVGSLEEVTRAHEFLAEKGVKINRRGRDMPGSNWHCYFQTPDGQTCEVYYGMEQVGINGRSKPMGYYDRRFNGPFPLPQINDFDERDQAASRGVSMEDGFERKSLGGEARYDVAGSLLARPFKVTSIGPVGVFVDNMEESVAFYRDIMGFKVTETVNYKGHDFVYLRYGNEHHSLKLYPIEAREMLGLRPDSRTVSMGMRVGSYKQLSDAVDWLKGEGVKFIEQPEELSPGVGYCAHGLDAEGNCVQLHYYMEQLNVDGSRRPENQRQTVQTPWPEALESLDDTYADQTFMGPLG